MTMFMNFTEALNFNKKCPICNKKLKISKTNNDLLKDYKNKILFFYITTFSKNDLFTIDTNNGKFSYIELGPFKNNFKQNGKLLQALIIECTKCMMYNYTLQIHINLTDNKVDCLILNSETLSFIDNNELYKIKNIYTTDTTEFINVLQNKITKLPLILLDIKNINNTIDRVKNILPFL